MSQLKYRISIGKVVNGEWKFDHYARGYEMEYLRPKAYGGGVEKISVEQVYDPRGADREDYIPRYDIEITDVSDTHRIELGCAMYFENNIYRAKKHVSIGVSGWRVPKDTNIFIYHRYNGFYVIFMDETGMCQIDINTHNKWSDCFELIGNIHENPELMEVT